MNFNPETYYNKQEIKEILDPDEDFIYENWLDQELLDGE